MKEGEENWREKIEVREREEGGKSHGTSVWHREKWIESRIEKKSMAEKTWSIPNWFKLTPTGKSFRIWGLWLYWEERPLFLSFFLSLSFILSLFLSLFLSSTLEVPLPQKLTHFLYTLSPKSHVKVLVTFLFTYQWPLSCIDVYLSIPIKYLCVCISTIEVCVCVSVNEIYSWLGENDDDDHGMKMSCSGKNEGRKAIVREDGREK